MGEKKGEKKEGNQSVKNGPRTLVVGKIRKNNLESKRITGVCEEEETMGGKRTK